ncbi:late expression factor 5 [Phthorimaea operculella granulovirus]|uniref:Late expression factor 5 n=1 Tax=Phthorimaea operculella granulovirus TaxID=192584 RepID=Q8JRY0_9BBAC|nr:late expression factor 5 [Phthorimaea operculella granulovirus]AAM70277.1 late expression factor 5 [Phthorimaea operculella granulovirus]ANY57468.1 late expression factor 5 [Phthorimaea operculella granulovirus]QBH65914.1 late expression factor 5 [Phthorimaea operculella granulovirus]QBH66044.1 late expression factor 5 [Phthorimaea operculella granulovirus]QBH66174.1 late expression factor 5 [Phthorimaea operculella granulovirus]
MSFDNGTGVVQNDPIHLFNVFSKFRQECDYEGLVKFLITNYPQNVKNRTFNFHNTGHVFHMLYAYVPSPSSKERKQIRLDCVEKLLNSTRNDFKLYEDLIALMVQKGETKKCPCELISARLNDNIAYNENLKSKNFDIKPCKLKKEPIDAILFKYSINWKNSLNKRKGETKTSTKNTNTAEKSVIVVDEKKILRNTHLSQICGATVKQCVHKYVTDERQLRAGDESVSFVTYCVLCGIKK